MMTYAAKTFGLLMIIMSTVPSPAGCSSQLSHSVQMNKIAQNKNFSVNSPKVSLSANGESNVFAYSTTRKTTQRFKMGPGFMKKSQNVNVNEPLKKILDIKYPFRETRRLLHKKRQRHIPDPRVLSSMPRYVSELYNKYKSGELNNDEIAWNTVRSIPAKIAELDGEQMIFFNLPSFSPTEILIRANVHLFKETNNRLTRVYSHYKQNQKVDWKLILYEVSPHHLSKIGSVLVPFFSRGWHWYTVTNPVMSCLSVDQFYPRQLAMYLKVYQKSGNSDSLRPSNIANHNLLPFLLLYSNETKMLSLQELNTVSKRLKGKATKEKSSIIDTGYMETPTSNVENISAPLNQYDVDFLFFNNSHLLNKGIKNEFRTNDSLFKKPVVLYENISKSRQIQKKINNTTSKGNDYFGNNALNLNSQGSIIKVKKKLSVKHKFADNEKNSSEEFPIKSKHRIMFVYLMTRNKILPFGNEASGKPMISKFGTSVYNIHRFHKRSIIINNIPKNYEEILQYHHSSKSLKTHNNIFEKRTNGFRKVKRRFAHKRIKSLRKNSIPQKVLRKWHRKQLDKTSRRQLLPQKWINTENEEMQMNNANIVNKSNTCSRRHFVVDFADIGWADWIIYPKSFEAHFCSGTCAFPITKNLNPSNHATIQSIVEAVGLHKNVPAPCCVPESLSSVTLLFYDENNNAMLRKYPGMSVENCVCR